MTEQELKAIEARANAATPGPMAVVSRGTPHDYDIQPTGDPLAVLAFPGYHRGMFGQAADALFYACARDDVPLLVAEVRRLQALLRRSAVVS